MNETPTPEEQPVAPAAVPASDSLPPAATPEPIVERLRDANPGLDIVYRDLTTTPLGHLTGSHLAAGQGAAPEA